MAKIKIAGVDYQVVQNLGFQPSIGCNVKVVKTEGGNKVAIRAQGMNPRNNFEWVFKTSPPQGAKPV